MTIEEILTDRSIGFISFHPWPDNIEDPNGEKVLKKGILRSEPDIVNGYSFHHVQPKNRQGDIAVFMKD